MNLETDRLRIRDLTPDDAASLFLIYSDPQVRRFIGGEPTATLDEQREQLAATLQRQSNEKPGYGRWAVETREERKLVGIVILKHPPDASGQPLPEVEVGWHLARSSWGHGYATKAAQAILHHAFETLNLTEVFAVVRPENHRSIRVTERLGMQPLGTTNRYYGVEALHFRIQTPSLT